ncbi:hypothetical protein LINPERHAP2_LOCUS25448, partial [Linum perenne]
KNPKKRKESKVHTSTIHHLKSQSKERRGHQAKAHSSPHPTTTFYKIIVSIL